MIKFNTLNRFTGNVQFTAEIDCDENASHSLKIGLAVKWAIKNSADLGGAYLRDADLRDANLWGANLRDANLRSANLGDANLRDAYLRDADLRSANLRDANLRDADLRGAILRDANLRDANLRDAKGAEFAIAQTRILPEGDLIGWKSCTDNVLVKLKIPAEAKRSHAFGRKCRAEFADVLEVIGADIGIAKHDGETEYRAGERVTCHEWCDDWQQECAGGIHFFITRLEAENY